jgi:integrase
MYWVPLIALFSGMRLREIIQMQVADIKTQDGVDYFDVTAIGQGMDGDEEGGASEEKSLKTASSRRRIPIHKSLRELGFMEFVALRRSAALTRLFPEYSKAKDDDSWSKQFSKRFRQFRVSIGVKRSGVTFRSLRHNVEDA